jgi:hypothetical protein
VLQLLTTFSGLLGYDAGSQEAASPGFADAKDVFGASMPIHSNKELERL